MTAAEIAIAVKSGKISAREAAKTALARIAAHNGAVNAFTDVTSERARAEADAIDAAIARREDPGPLAGVPYAAKNLFDLAGLATRAGSLIERATPPAAADAFLVAQLRRAGAICLGALNMDEYAYGFTTENFHDGPARNPHDLSRIAGGSSGGSGAALAAGLASLTLGTDTNGSIRVPASLCGVFGLKPTFGRLSRSGAFPFVASIDCVGPFARDVASLAAAYDAMAGRDPADPAQAPRAAEPIGPLPLPRPLRAARLGGYFAGEGPARAAADRVAAALGATEEAAFPDPAAARAAAFLITASEGGSLHLPDLRARAADFDPNTRDRLLAGALLPASWVHHAQSVRRDIARRAAPLFARFDILIAPATPAAATPIGQQTIALGGETVPLRPNLGIFTQPISCLGLPVLAVPLPEADGALPIGVQLIAAPWREDLLFAAASALEAIGLCRAPLAPAFAQ
ncbi:MAG TPA: AtzE family amidohydrolase [Acetobacteraceae bacterium]|nr:AtzE family amidohydrolase [Acetobacteraceae bacterium]